VKHIVVDVRAMSSHRDGITTYLREMAPRLVAQLPDARFTFLVGRHGDEAREWGPTVLVAARPMWPAQNVRLPVALRPLDPDLLLYPAHDPPVFGSTPTVMAVHDLTTLTLRPFFERGNAVRQAYLRAVVGRAVARARTILVPSVATQDQVRQLFPDAVVAKTRVIPYASRFAPTAAITRAEHFLFIGNDRPHKNLRRVLDAYGQAVALEPALPPLVLAGRLREPATVMEWIERAEVRERVAVLGHVEDEELVALMRASAALVAPSVAEGFGLSILDAMTLGAPVITSDRSACAEVAGPAAVLVDPHDARAIAAAMVRVAREPALRERLSARGRARAAGYSWDRAAEQTALAISDALTGRQAKERLPAG
jgi:glycosyltransferase involved in cell wall biosynthesis